MKHVTSSLDSSCDIPADKHYPSILNAHYLTACSVPVWHRPPHQPGPNTISFALYSRAVQQRAMPGSSRLPAAACRAVRAVSGPVQRRAHSAPERRVAAEG